MRVHNYSGILATRFFLGLAEAGVFPGSQSFQSHAVSREVNVLPRLLLDQPLVQARGIAAKVYSLLVLCASSNHVRRLARYRHLQHA